MAFESMVYQIMIASPGDVENERNIISKTIYEWNTLNTYKDKIVLLPVRWETHSSPEMGNGPQEILNDQILKMSDLLIGVFWTRLGTPTEKAESGTVEEIREHIKAGKPAMVYFSNQPINPDNIDYEQYTKLKQFKEECQSMGLYVTYNSLEDFQEKLRRGLSLKISNHEYFKDKNISNEKDEEIISQINLTNEAITLLIEAAKSSSGGIRRVSADQGLIFLVDNKSFGTINNPRSEATWDHAIELLLNYELVKKDSPEGSFFGVTRVGYEYADILNS